MADSFVDTISGQTLDCDLGAPGERARDLPGLCTDLFLIVIRMREAEDLGDPASLRKLIRFYLDRFKKNCAAAGIPDDTVHAALYAIVALIDETVLSVPGPCREFWIARPLQLDSFGDNIAGQEFFKKLQKAQTEKQNDVLEIFYLCLSLGFEGKYKIGNPEELAAIIEETGRNVGRARVRTASRLSPHGNRQDFVSVHKRDARFPLWAGAAIAGGACLAVYLVMSLVTSLDLARVLKIVEQLR